MPSRLPWPSRRCLRCIRTAEVFRQNATALAADLAHDDQRDAATQALRGFLDKFGIPPRDELLQVIGN